MITTTYPIDTWEVAKLTLGDIVHLCIVGDLLLAVAIVAVTTGQLGPAALLGLRATVPHLDGHATRVETERVIDAAF